MLRSPPGMGGCVEDHPAPSLSGAVPGCDQGCGASPGLCEAASAAAAAPKPLPRGHSPGWAARMGPSASTVLLPPAPALASCGWTRSSPGGGTLPAQPPQTCPHPRSSAWPPGSPVPRTPTISGKEGSGHHLGWAKGSFFAITPQYSSLGAKKKKNPQIFSPQFGNSPQKLPFHLEGHPQGVPIPPPCPSPGDRVSPPPRRVPLPAPAPPSLAAGCGRSSIT